MKVHELKMLLENLDEEADILVCIRETKRFSGQLTAIQTIGVTIDQDTNKGFYTIEVDEPELYRK